MVINTGKSYKSFDNFIDNYCLDNGLIIDIETINVPCILNLSTKKLYKISTQNLNDILNGKKTKLMEVK